MANNGTTPLGKKVDLSREVQGTLARSSLDPTMQAAVLDGYSLGTSSDGVTVLEGKDTSDELAFFRLKAGLGVTVSQQGNSVLITSTVLAGGTAGVMLTSVYDTNGDGIVDQAAVADSVAWGNITGTPTQFPPAPHTHPESDVVNLTTDLANKVPITRLVTTSFSLQGGGPLSGNLTLSLIGDKANVGPDQRYGTDPSGNLGWYPASVGAGDMTQAVYDKNSNGIVDLAEAVIPGAITTAMLGVGCVTGKNIASSTIPGSALAVGAVPAALGYTPLNKAGDVAKGQIAVLMPGPNITANMYQSAHLLAETSGTGAGYPTIGLACLSGGSNAGAVALWYQGAHGDIQLEYGDGTAAHLLSSISSISGVQIAAGSIQGAALASGAAQTNLGFTPVNGSAGGTYSPTGAVAYNTAYGLAASSWSTAPLRVESTVGGGARPQIGFYYPGTAASLYFEPVDISFRYIDSAGTIRILLDSQHGVSAANLQAGAAVGNIGYQPLNKNGDIMTGAVLELVQEIGVNASSWASNVIYLRANNTSCRPCIGFEIPGATACSLFLDIDGQLKYYTNSSQIRTLSWT